MNLYALVAIGVLALGSYALYERGNAAIARSKDLTAQRDRAIQAVKDSAETIEALKATNVALDATIVERDRRSRALEKAKRDLRKELDELKQALPKEDQDCLDRPLPPAILERLRN